MNKVLILVIDGCAPEYLTKDTAPDVFCLASKYGFAKTVHSMMPSVTNVNHACILTGCFPAVTKVVGNYYYDPITTEEGFIEERGFMKAPTIFHAYKRADLSTALFTVKGKVLGVYGDGADIGLSAQTPDTCLLQKWGLDAPPSINSHDSTKWILDATFACIKDESPDLVYCTTNDYVFHHYAPGTPEAKKQIEFVNDFIRQVHALEPSRSIYITADHGMNQKTHLINFQTIADRAQLDLFCLAPLKDRYIENHIYQEGGILYIYLKDKSDAGRLISLAESIPEIECVLSASAAANLYHLPEESIGDYVLFAAHGCAFGEVAGERLKTEHVRTHGSLYEREIPLIAIHPHASENNYQYNKDIVSQMLLV